MTWRTISVLRTELQLEQTLTGGQSFRWKHEKDSNTFIGVFANIVWRFKQDDTSLHYKVVAEVESSGSKIRLKVEPPAKSQQIKNQKLYPESYYENLVRSYFRLNINLSDLYEEWRNAHQHFKSVSNSFFAVRMLNQDPVENTISFICSQNNNISRITTMVEKICKLFGEKIIDDYYTFPDLKKLCDDKIETVLRAEKFGYRAKYINQAAKQITEKGGLNWFQKLTEMKYKEAHNELTGIYGIGAKVADCICLMSLDHLEAIPVDTHIFQLAKIYLPNLKAKTVTPKVYNEVADYFRKIYGDYSGWAQTVLFVSDLRSFKN